MKHASPFKNVCLLINKCVYTWTFSKIRNSESTTLRHTQTPSPRIKFYFKTIQKERTNMKNINNWWL